MKKLMILILCVMFIESIAYGETATIPQGSHESFYLRFLATYCSASRSYWIMVKTVASTTETWIPFGDKYHVYTISEDMKNVSLAFSTRRRIYSILPTENKLFYELEVLFDPMSAELWCLDTQSGSKTKIIKHPINSIVAYANNEILYFDLDRNLCSFSFISGEERIIMECMTLISSDDMNLYLRAADKSIWAYSLLTGLYSPYTIPGELVTHAITMGYGNIVDRDSYCLYRSDGDLVQIPELQSSSAVGLNNTFLCFFHPNIGKFSYLSLMSPEHIISIDVKSIDGNINLVNNQVFFYTENAEKISVISLSQGTQSYIELQ